MKKGLLIALVVALVLTVMVPAAMALTDNQKAELETLYEQREQLCQQILDKRVEAGLVTPEDATVIRERMAERREYQKERMAEGEYGLGTGRRGGRDFGRGFGRQGGFGLHEAPADNTTL